MARELPYHKIPGAGWKADPDLGLGVDEAYRVTSLLSVINKPALVGWAGKVEGQAYEAALRQAFLDDPGLAIRFPIASANTDDGKIDSFLDDLVETVRLYKGKIKAAEKKKNEASDIGSAAHAVIEYEVRKALGQDVDMPKTRADLRPAVNMMLEAWLDWIKRNKFKPKLAEQRVYSYEERWTGTLDIAGLVNGQMAVIDIKSSNGIYVEQLMQVSAYCMGVELGNEMPIGIILRLPKTEQSLRDMIDETGQPFEERIIAAEEVVKHYQAFLAAKELYEAMRRLKAQED